MSWRETIDGFDQINYIAPYIVSVARHFAMGVYMRGADVIVQALIDHGVRILPGISGNTVLDITDAMYDRPEIKYLTVRHEQVAAAMADGWARATGNPARS